jgi:aspartokinase
VAATASLLELTSAQYGAEALQVLGEHEVALRHVELYTQPGGESALSASLLTDDVPDWPKTLQALTAASHGALSVSTSEGTVTAVGPSLGSDPALLVRIRHELAHAGLHPRRLTTNPLRITAWLPSGEVAAATTLLHTLLCQLSPLPAPR